MEFLTPSIAKFIQHPKFLRNDTNGTWFERYDYNEYKTSEKERAFGANLPNMT